MDRVYSPEHRRRLSVRSRQPLRAQTLHFSTFANPQVPSQLQTQRSRGQVHPTGPLTAQDFLVQRALGNGGFNAYNSEAFASSSAVPLSVRPCPPKVTHANTNANPMLRCESTITQSNHNVQNRTQLLTPQVFGGELNRGTQAFAVRASAVMPAMSPSTHPPSTSPALAANGALVPSQGSGLNLPGGTYSTQLRMAHLSQMPDPACHVGSRLHTPSGCHQTNSKLLTNTSFVRSDVPPNAHIPYHHVQFGQGNVPFSPSHHSTNVAYGAVTAGSYPGAQGLAKPVNPTFHSMHPSSRTGDQQHFHPTEAMIRAPSAVEHASNCIFYPVVTSTAVPQACYDADPNSNLLPTNASVTTRAEAFTGKSCSENQFSNTKFNSATPHRRDDPARPSSSALLNSNIETLSPLHLEGRTITNPSRALSSAPPLLFNFPPGIDPSNAQQHNSRQTARGSVISKRPVLLSAASPDDRIQARNTDIGFADAQEEERVSDAHTNAAQITKATETRTPRRQRLRNKTTAAKSRELNSKMTVESTPVSKDVFSDTTLQVQIPKEKCSKPGGGGNLQSKCMQSENCEEASVELDPKISKPTASSIQSIHRSLSSRNNFV